MRKGSLGIVAILFCISTLFVGCGNKNCSAENQFDIVGVYSTEGYVPSAEDISMIPYTYQGQGEYFSVTCNIRELNTDEYQFTLVSKEQSISQLQQLKEEYPERSKDYEGMIEKVQSEIAAIENADVLYCTELYGTYIGNENIDTSKEIISYSISNENVIYMSSGVMNANLWVSLLNTAYGSYSEGILLSHMDNYEITVRYGDITDTFILHLAG